MKKIVCTLLTAIMLCFTFSQTVYAVEIVERPGRPDPNNSWATYLGIPKQDEIKTTIQKALTKSIQRQLSTVTLPAEVGSEVSVPLKLDTIYEYFKFDKEKLVQRNSYFWYIRNNNHRVVLDEVSLKDFTISHDGGSEIEVTITSNKLSSKENTTLTIKRLQPSKRTEYQLTIANALFESDGYFNGPWGWWDGTYGNRILEPGHWDTTPNTSHGGLEEFDDTTPVYHYRTTPNGPTDDIQMTLTAEPKEEGKLSLTAPEKLMFNDIAISDREQIIQRSIRENLGLIVTDGRDIDNQDDWYLTAQVQNQDGSLAPYLIYREPGQSDQYLMDNARVYAHTKQENTQSPLEVNISDTWSDESGLLLKIPVRNSLRSNQAYQTTITWNLVKAP
ncbi:hypothetical protein [Listeria rocourtiae]|uniref:hypothetical protein n=1 Tax=Listeria rocourtiae TaxID=647910 RepID=UPI003D2F8761